MSKKSNYNKNYYAIYFYYMKIYSSFIQCQRV